MNWSLKTVVIPKNVKSIGNGAFNPSSIQQFDVDSQNTVFHSTNDKKGIIETATHILVAACKDLEIPQEVVGIGNGVFYDCNFSSKTLPENLQSIGRKAFEHCYLKTIDLPESLKKIDEEAFLGCVYLDTITVHWQTPIEIPDNVFRINFLSSINGYGDDAHDYVYNNAVLYIPKGTRDIYASTKGWNRFQKILEEGEVDLNPFTDEEEETDFSEDLKNVEDLSGVVINNIYYSTNTENGDGFDDNNNCLVFNSTLSDSDEEDLDNSAYIPENFYGICFLVPQGKGRVTLDVETSGDRTVGVKIGTHEPRRFVVDNRKELVVEYEVFSPTYIYVYPSNKPTTRAGRKVTSSSDCIKLYSLKWNSIDDATSIVGFDNGEVTVDRWYSIDGVKLNGEPTKKGVYIRNGKKIVK